MQIRLRGSRFTCGRRVPDVVMPRTFTLLACAMGHGAIQLIGLVGSPHWAPAVLTQSEGVPVSGRSRGLRLVDAGSIIGQEKSDLLRRED